MKESKVEIGNRQLAKINRKIALYVWSIAFCLLSIVFLTGCDKIEGDHFETTAETDTNYTFPADTTPDVYRVLMEDYTGHTCGNCPVASTDLYNNIKPLYGDKLVTLGVHANFFAEPCPPHSRPPGSPVDSYKEDFRTPAGEDWYTDFQLYSNPLGMVNRKDYPSGNVVKTSTSWNSEIAGIINNTPKVKIRIHNVYNPSTRILKTYSETKFLTPLSGNYNLNVLLSEDSIITWQLVDTASNPNVPDYIQRHVMRGALNGSYGEQLNISSTTSADTKFFTGYLTTLPADWDANHVHVVVFLYNYNTKEILNVAEEAAIE